MHPMLNIAVRAARKAGSIINRAALDGGGLKVTAKRANDFVYSGDPIYRDSNEPNERIQAEFGARNCCRRISVAPEAHFRIPC